MSVTNQREFESGAVRDNRNGKGRHDLIYYPWIVRGAIRLGEGAEHYGDRNWEKGMNVMDIYDSLQRHLYQLIMGDTSEDHSAAIFCNAMFLDYMIKEKPEYDDRPKYREGYKDNRTA